MNSLSSNLKEKSNYTFVRGQKTNCILLPTEAWIFVFYCLWNYTVFMRLLILASKQKNYLKRTHYAT